MYLPNILQNCKFMNVEPRLCIYPTYYINVKELSLCIKLWFSNTYIFSTCWSKPLIFQTLIFSSNRIHSLKYLRFTAFDYKDIEIRKSYFVTKTQFLYEYETLVMYLTNILQYCKFMNVEPRLCIYLTYYNYVNL